MVGGGDIGCPNMVGGGDIRCPNMVGGGVLMWWWRITVSKIN